MMVCRYYELLLFCTIEKIIIMTCRRNQNFVSKLDALAIQEKVRPLDLDKRPTLKFHNFGSAILVIIFLPQR